MRDLVWTIIVIWLVWKIYDVFTKGKTQPKNQTNSQKNNDIKIDTSNYNKSHFNPKDAEYVDYEEIK